jgi:hypothetical protein
MKKTVQVRGKDRDVEFDKQEGKQPSTHAVSVGGVAAGLCVADGDDWQYQDAWGGSGEAGTLEGVALLAAQALDRNAPVMKGRAQRTAPRAGVEHDPALDPPVTRRTRSSADPLAQDADPHATVSRVASTPTPTMGESAPATAARTTRATNDGDGNAAAPGVGGSTGAGANTASGPAAP